MVNKQEQIAAFLDKNIAWPRVANPYGALTGGYPWAMDYPNAQWQRPTAEQLGQELFGTAEYRALQLGTWLGTTDGQVIAQAVEMVSPPFYRQDIELLVGGLQHAAKMQQGQGEQVAGRFALATVGVFALLLLIAGSSRSGGAA